MMRVAILMLFLLAFLPGPAIASVPSPPHGWEGVGKGYPPTIIYKNAGSLRLTGFGPPSGRLCAVPQLAKSRRSRARPGLNQYTDVGGAAIAHDAHGNLIRHGAWRYAYDLENRMVWAGECFDAAACTSDGQALTRATFAYDPHGRRFEKGVFTGTGTPVSTTQFFHDGDVLLAEFYQGTRSDGSGDTGLYPYRVWHHAGTRPVRVQTVGLDGAITSQQALMLDWQGSVVAAVDETSGQLMDRYRYSPYGLPTEAAGLPIRYTGHYYDAELGEAGLYYARARVYDPLTGRFHQTDPIGYEDDLNWYAYVKNDPVNYTDPTGLAVECVTNADGQLECRENNEDGIGKTEVVGERPDRSRGNPELVDEILRRIENQEFENDFRLTDQRVDEIINLTLDKLIATCIAENDAATLGLTGAGAMAAGANAFSTRGKPAGATSGTSLASRLGRAFDAGFKSLFGKKPMMPKSPHLNSVTAGGLRRAPTVGGFLGRATPIIGSGLLGAGAGIVSGCNKAVNGG